VRVRSESESESWRMQEAEAELRMLDDEANSSPQGLRLSADKSCRLQLFRPVGSTTHPVIIFFLNPPSLQSYDDQAKSRNQPVPGIAIRASPVLPPALAFPILVGQRTLSQSPPPRGMAKKIGG
jgi:hypothetical protein